MKTNQFILVWRGVFEPKTTAHQWIKTDENDKVIGVFAYNKSNSNWEHDTAGEVIPTESGNNEELDLVKQELATATQALEDKQLEVAELSTSKEELVQKVAELEQQVADLIVVEE